LIHGTLKIKNVSIFILRKKYKKKLCILFVGVNIGVLVEITYSKKTP